MTYRRGPSDALLLSVRTAAKNKANLLLHSMVSGLLPKAAHKAFSGPYSFVTYALSGASSIATRLRGTPWENDGAA